MSNLSVPNTFVSGTPIVAADMNANFDAVEAIVNVTGVPVVQDGVIGTSKIADEAVTRDKLASDSVTATKLADDAVTDANRAVTTNHIRDGAVTEAKVASGAVTTAKLSSAQAFVASGNISSSGGRVVTYTGAASQTLTLPVGTSGFEFEVWNIDASDAVTVARAGSDTINGATSLSVPAGAAIHFRCIAANTWVARFVGPWSKVGHFNGPSGTGNYAVTGLGFKPRVVQFSSSFVASTLVAYHGQGAMDASGAQWAHASVVDGTNSKRTDPVTDACIRLTDSGGTAQVRAVYVSMDADGFTVNFTTAGTNYRIGWIAHA